MMDLAENTTYTIYITYKNFIAQTGAMVVNADHSDNCKMQLGYMGYRKRSDSCQNTGWILGGHRPKKH